MKSGMKIGYKHSYKFIMKCGDGVKLWGHDEVMTDNTLYRKE
jgi:hypothetical protein